MSQETNEASIRRISTRDVRWMCDEAPKVAQRGGIQVPSSSADVAKHGRVCDLWHLATSGNFWHHAASCLFAEQRLQGDAWSVSAFMATQDTSAERHGFLRSFPVIPCYPLPSNQVAMERKIGMVSLLIATISLMTWDVYKRRSSFAAPQRSLHALSTSHLS